jgi:hypothetical protein
LSKDDASNISALMARGKSWALVIVRYSHSTVKILASYGTEIPSRGNGRAPFIRFPVGRRQIRSWLRPAGGPLNVGQQAIGLGRLRRGKLRQLARIGGR